MDALRGIFMSIEDRAHLVRRALLPSASGTIYEKAFRAFGEFCAANNHESESMPSRDLYLLYFQEAATMYAPSTLWNKYSMINTVGKSRYNVDLRVYAPDVTVFL